MERHLYSPRILDLMGATSDHHAMIGDSNTGGDLFRVYARRLFKRSDFDELHATVGNDDTDIEAESAWTPDYQFLHKRSGHIFWVECKFCSDYYFDEVETHRSDALDRYRKFQEEAKPQKLFLVTGYGGRPLKPASLFCMPLDEMEFDGIHPDVLEKYERDPSRPFNYQGGRLI